MNKEIIKKLISQGFTVEEALDLVKPEETKTEEAKTEEVTPEETKTEEAKPEESFKEVISSLIDNFNNQVKELNHKLDTSIKTQQAINAKTSNIEINEKKAEDFLGQWLNNGHVINDNKEE